MHCKSLILFLAGFSAAVAAGIPVELQEKKADGLNGWSRGAEKIVRFVEEGERKDVLEIRLEKPVRNHVYGITRALDPAGIAGLRVTLSAEVWRDIRVYQKWQGGKLMISVRFPNGKYGAIPGKHDDRVMSRAIGLYVSRFEWDRYPVKRKLTYEELTARKTRLRKMGSGAEIIMQ